MEIVIAVVVIAALVVIGLVVYSSYSNAKVQREREAREVARYGTVSTATAAPVSAPSSTSAPVGQVETKTVTLRMRERVGIAGSKPPADAKKLEALLADGWEIASQSQAPHGARMTTYVLRRTR